MKKAAFILLVIFLTNVLKAQYSVGDHVDDFRLKSTDGTLFSLKDQKNAKGFIIAFTCNTCPVAKLYEQRINDLNNKFAPLGFPVVAINPNDITKKPGDSMDEMIKKISENGFGFTYLRDDDQSVAKKFGAERTPEIYLVVKKQDNFILAYTGAIDNNPESAMDADKLYVEAAIEDILNGKQVLLAETRAVGCSIKWAE